MVFRYAKLQAEMRDLRHFEEKNLVEVEVDIESYDPIGPVVTMGKVADITNTRYVRVILLNGKVIGHLEREYVNDNDTTGGVVPEAVLNTSPLCRYNGDHKQHVLFVNSDSRHVGMGFRFNDYIVCPNHVYEQSSHWHTGNSGKAYALDRAIVITSADWAMFRPDARAFASTGLSKFTKMSLVYPNQYVKVVGWNKNTGEWQVSSGNIVGEGKGLTIRYKASTIAGFSGAAVLANDKVVGMHLGYDDSVGTNVFTPISLFKSLLCKEKDFREQVVESVRQESAEKNNPYYGPESERFRENLNDRVRRALERMENPKNQRDYEEAEDELADVSEWLDVGFMDMIEMHGADSEAVNDMVTDRMLRQRDVNKAAKRLARPIIRENTFVPQSSDFRLGSAVIEIDLTGPIHERGQRYSISLTTLAPGDIYSTERPFAIMHKSQGTTVVIFGLRQRVQLAPLRKMLRKLSISLSRRSLRPSSTSQRVRILLRRLSVNVFQTMEFLVEENLEEVSIPSQPVNENQAQPVRRRSL
jgi:hypothetical protein